MLMGEMSYKDAGVNVDLGNDVSKILFEAAKKTWENRSGRLGEIVEISSDFSGLRGIHVGGLPVGTYLGSGSDGVGTKIEVAERIGRHNSIAYDLFAMVCDDAIIRGAEPVIVTSDLSINRFGDNQNNYIDFVKELAKGYVDAAKQTGVAVINGESAELGDRIRGYGDFNYNWNASVIWFGKKDRMFTREKIKILGHRILLTFLTAARTPWPRYEGLWSRSSVASWVPVEVPEGTLARERPLLVRMSVSMVGRPRESSICRDTMCLIRTISPLLVTRGWPACVAVVAYPI